VSGKRKKSAGPKAFGKEEGAYRNPRRKKSARKGKGEEDDVRLTPDRRETRIRERTNSALEGKKPQRAKHTNTNKEKKKGGKRRIQTIP